MKCLNTLRQGFRKKRCLFTAFTTAWLVLYIVPGTLDAYVRKFTKHHQKKNQNPSRWISNTPIEFSQSNSIFFDENAFTESQTCYQWDKNETTQFTELILSWNALRPPVGTLTFWVNVKYGKNGWAGWQRMAEWGKQTQRSFINKNNPYVHTKHVRVEMQHGSVGQGFKVKVTSHNGASLKDLRALFVGLCDLKKFKLVRLKEQLPSVIIHGVPKQSQMVLDHPRYRDLCSPTSTSIIVNYFASKIGTPTIYPNLDNYIGNFADNVYDRKLNIYGNWQLNVAQAFDAAHGDIFFRVERLNSFKDLHAYLMKKIPVAVSVHRLAGGAMPYKFGHFMVVVGWDNERQRVLCIDPAFKNNSSTSRAYKLWDFLQAWGRSVNLSYIPMPNNQVFSPLAPNA